MIDDSEFDDIFNDDVDFQDLLGEEDHSESESHDSESESIRQLMETLNHTSYSDKFADYFKVTTLLINAVIDDQVARMNRFSESEPMLQTAVTMLLEEFYGESWKHVLVAQHLANIQQDINIDGVRKEFDQLVQEIDQIMDDLDPGKDQQEYGFLEVFKSNLAAVMFCFDVLENYIDETVLRFANSPDKLAANMSSSGGASDGDHLEDNIYFSEMQNVLKEMLQNMKNKDLRD